MDQREAAKLKYLARVKLREGFKIDDPGWARVWVEAEEPIPEVYRSLFYEELCNKDAEYREALEESINWFGVRFV